MKPLTTPPKRDGLSATDLWTTRVLLVLAPLALLLGTIAPRIEAWATGEPLKVVTHAERIGPPTGETLRAGAAAHWGDTWEYTIPHPTVGQRLADLLAPVTLLALLVVAVVLVWRMLDRVAVGDPFRRDAMRAFTVLGSLLAVGAVCLPMMTMLSRMLVLFPVQETPSLYLRATAQELAMALAGFAGAGLVTALGHAFRRGTALREDSEGLV